MDEPPLPFGAPWSDFFDNLAGQGGQFDAPLSPSNQYYAFLSKADLDPSTGMYDVFFELVNREWWENAMSSLASSINKIPDGMPAVAYHMPAVQEADLLQVLNLKSPDYIAEGSWYLIELTPGGSGSLSGEVYNPDIDFLPYTT